MRTKEVRLSSNAFRVGDQVSWTSQSRGTSLTKAGTIAAVVRPGQAAFEAASAAKRTVRPTNLQNLNPAYAALSRSDVSYVVNVGGKAYWPRVQKLQKVS